MNEPTGTHNEFGGQAANVVQAGEIREVHFHTAPRQAREICQVPTASAHYTDNERQLAELDTWLTHDADGRPPRVAILRGPPGSGTTTLAIYWVHQHKQDYPDGHFYVRLDSGADGTEQERPALKELLQAAGHHPEEIPESLHGRSALWRSWSTGKRVQVVLDDVTTASQVGSLLPGAGSSVVLVTEKGRLGGVYAMADARAVDMSPMSDEASRELLGRIAGAERVAAEPDAVASVIGLCGGLAIALSVVATLLAEHPERPISRLAGRLARDGRRLRELSQDASLSVTVVFDAAFDRLSDLAKWCYAVLGVHPGTGDVGADAVAAALGEDPDDVADALADLQAAKLVTETADERFLMSPLIRTHARVRAEGDSTVDGVLDVQRVLTRLLAHYTRVALAAEKLVTPNRGWREQLWPDLVVRPAEGAAEAAMAWLETERATLFAAVQLAFERGDEETVCRLALALWPLHERGGHSHDMVETNAMAVRMTTDSGADLPTAVFCFQCAFGHRQRADLDRGIQYATEGQAAAERAGSANAEASIVELFGLLRLDGGQPAEAAELLRRNVELAEGIGHDRRLALARFHLARATPPAEAGPLLEAARPVFEAGNEPYNVAKVDLWRGRTAIAEGRLAEADPLLTALRADAARHGWHREHGQSVQALGDLAYAGGDRVTGRERLVEAERLFRMHGLDAEAEAVRDRLTELD